MTVLASYYSDLPSLEPPRSSKALLWGIGVSVAVHALLLVTRFVDPEALKFKNLPTALEVVLVNSKTASKPLKPEVLAQANLDGGGNTDDDRRAKSPLPARRHVENGDDLRRAQKRVEQLESKQRQLLAAAKSEVAVASEPARPVEEAPRAPQPSGVDLANMAHAMARLEAQIARQTEEYQKRPRKVFVGARATEFRFAQYVEDWRVKVENFGNLNYPSEARGRIYGSLRLTVSIRADGTVDNMQVERPSGYPMLDRAAEKIVATAAPYARFPPEIRRDTDIIVITRTWTFAPGDKLYGE